MDYSKDEKKWIEFFDRMADGQIPQSQGFYTIDDYTTATPPQEGKADPNIQIVSPTQQMVDQARSQLKRKAQSPIKIAKRRRTIINNKTKSKTKGKGRKKAKKVGRKTKRKAIKKLKRKGLKKKSIKRKYKY